MNFTNMIEMAASILPKEARKSKKRCILDIPSKKGKKKSKKHNKKAK